MVLTTEFLSLTMFLLGPTLGPTELILILILILFIYLCGTSTARVAYKKGRSYWGWFTLGFLFFPLALIVAFIVPKNQAVLDERSLQLGELQRCPFCTELVKVEAVKCRFCGGDIPESG